VSRDYKGKRVVVWATYIDSSQTRSQGRRLSREKAVWRPRLEEIVRAAEELGLDPVVEDSPYPRRWFEDKKRVVVDKVESKRKTLLLIAETIKKLREHRRS